jgi:hypothetical protein
MALSNGLIDYRGGTDEFLLFTTAGRDSVDEWVEYLTTDPRLIATEVQDIEIGGQPGVFTDVRLTGDSFTLFTYAPAPGDNAEWEVATGAADRVYLVEVDGTIIAILAEAPEDDFEDWTSAIDATLATLEWNP